MRSLVVLSAVFAVSVAAPQYLYFAQPENSPAIVLDELGRPLDTVDVVSARALHYQAKALEGHILKKRSIGHDAITAAVFEPVVETHAVYAAPSAVYTAPAAVSHQSRVDVRTSSPTVVATAPAVVAVRTIVEPASAIISTPVVTPVQTVVAAPAAVSHQSRVDVRTSAPTVVAAGPAVVATRTLTPTQTVVAAPTYINVPSAYVAPSATVYSGGAAVSHQSRVDVKTSPAVVAEQVIEPTYVSTSPVVAGAPAVVDARSVYVAPATTLYSTGSAVSHQSRVDVKSSPAVVAEKVVYSPSVYASTW